MYIDVNIHACVPAGRPKIEGGNYHLLPLLLSILLQVHTHHVKLHMRCMHKRSGWPKAQLPHMTCESYAHVNVYVYAHACVHLGMHVVVVVAMFAGC
jgi:hypothetical protein